MVVLYNFENSGYDFSIFLILTIIIIAFLLTIKMEELGIGHSYFKIPKKNKIIFIIPFIVFTLLGFVKSFSDYLNLHKHLKNDNVIRIKGVIEYYDINIREFEIKINNKTYNLNFPINSSDYTIEKAKEQIKYYNNVELIIKDNILL